MTIRSQAAFDRLLPCNFDGVFDWDFLTPAFQEATGRRIEPMDIDFHVEIGGHHLVIETKGVGVPLKDGQKRALLQLWSKGYHTVIFLWDKDNPMLAEIYYPFGTTEKIERRPLTAQKLFEICYRWAKWANANPCPFQWGG